MTILKLKGLCQKIKGVKKLRASKFGDGVFLYYEETGGHNFTDFIPLDTWEKRIEQTKMEYERFFK